MADSKGKAFIQILTLGAGVAIGYMVGKGVYDKFIKTALKL